MQRNGRAAVLLLEICVRVCTSIVMLYSSHAILRIPVQYSRVEHTESIGARTFECMKCERVTSSVDLQLIAYLSFYLLFNVSPSVRNINRAFYKISDRRAHNENHFFSYSQSIQRNLSISNQHIINPLINFGH